MVKTITSFMAILALCFMASSASAVDATATAGAQLVIAVDTGVIPGATNLTFQPSSQVSISASSERTNFAVAAGHDAVQGKEAGQNYGMASDSSNVWWISALATPYAAIDVTNSSYFSANNWNRN